MQGTPFSVLLTNPSPCKACGKTVYPKEMMSPINGVVFHTGCFKCKVCGTQLTIQAYTTSGADPSDDFVYCRRHQPKKLPEGVTLDSVNMQNAMRSQANLKVEKQMHHRSSIGMDSSAIISVVAAQALTKNPRHTYSRHHFNPVMERKRAERLRAVKLELEQQHREQEGQLLDRIQSQRKEAVEALDREMEKEWEVKLQELTSRFEKILEKKKKKKGKESEVLSQFESEKEELSRTLKLKKKAERRTLTAKLLPEERTLTSDLVSKQSEEMLRLIATTNQELEQSPESEGDQNGTAELQVPEPPPERKISTGEIATMTDEVTFPVPTVPSEPLPSTPCENLEASETEESVYYEELAPPRSPVIAVTPPTLRYGISGDPPAPGPPSCSKAELYTNPSIFTDLDEEVINIAEEEQSSFTDLSHSLTQNAATELEKVRAIFRWITVKDLSTLELETIISNPDTPLGILRGIKIGTETYHVLFMRLCSYAGIHCREIKGYSKSVGYEPGMTFDHNKFTNTWNAVLVDGEWRLVQCNWAARHLVFQRDLDPGKTPTSGEPSEPSENGTTASDHSGATAAAAKKRGDSLRYQYDEHYFLTDPAQFVYEFLPYEPKWQLLPEPISLREFETQPFVRSAFFQFGMRFPKDTSCVLEADQAGKTKVEVLMEKPDSVVCHYQLRYADDSLRRFGYFAGHKLDRFVVFQVLEDRLSFDVHLPTHQVGFFFEIFAAAVDPSDPAPLAHIKLKCVAKFRIVSPQPVLRRMNPLPPSAALSGEWGPTKAIRHFNIKPLSHGRAVVTESDRLSLQFWIPEAYLRAKFSAHLHANQINAHLLGRCLRISLEGNMLTLIIDPPHTAQYALDLFMRRPGVPPHLPASHVCKYLLNCSVTSPQDNLIVPDALMKVARLKPGATPLLKKFDISLEGLDPKGRIVTVEDTVHFRFRLLQPEVDFAFRLQLNQPELQDHSDLVEVLEEPQGVLCLRLPLIMIGAFQLFFCAKRRCQGAFELAYLLRIDRERSGHLHK